MHKRFSAFAKRALAFTLALVLLLALIPAVSLTAEAAYTTDGWEYDINYNWLEGRFHTDESDLIYEGNTDYDWYVSIYQGKRTAPLTVSATVTDASNKTVASVSNKSVTASKGEDSVMLSASDLTGLTTSLYGTFTLVCEVYYGSALTAKLTKTFQRVATTEPSEPTVPAEPENNIAVTVTSRSNPDNVFTFADPIDLVLNIKQTGGVAAAYNAAVTVTDKSGNEKLAARGISLPASTNITLSVKDLVNLPTIKTAGTYTVNLTMTDSNGAIKHQSSTDFGVVALENNLEATISSASGSSLTFNNMVPDMVVNLNKTDGIAETLITAVTVTNSSDTVTNSSDTVVYSKTFETTDANATITPDLSGLATTGTFTMTAVVTDDAGNLRATTSVNFTRAKVDYGKTTCSIYTAPKSVAGSIYADTSTTSSASSTDFSVTIQISNAKLKGNNVYIKAIGTLNGQPFVSPALEQYFTNNVVKATFTGKDLGSYGIFEDIHLAVYTADGDLLGRTTETYSFSRVLDTSNPGDLPLLNMNVHYTNMGIDPMLNQVKLASQAGAYMWRTTIRWDSVESEQGKYTMPSQLVDVMKQTKAQGMKALIILAYENKLYGSPDPDNNAWVNAYANYCKKVAQYMAENYPDQVVAFEIWNEWNHASMSKVPDKNDRTGTKYAKVVKSAYTAIKSVSNFKVIAGATAGDGYLEPGENPDSNNAYKFLNQFFAVSNIMNYFDGISFHTYSSTETTSNDTPSGYRTFEFISPTAYDFESRFESVKARLKNANKEIWLTETGWTTNAEPQSATGSTDSKTHITTGATELEQAAYLVQLYTWALADGTVDHIFWYDFLNDCNIYKNDENKTVYEWRTDLTECNYGLLHTWREDAGAPLAYSAKPGYVTMCALSSMLGGATYKGAVDLGGGVAAYSFTNKDGKTMVVAWTTSDTNKTLRCSGSMTVTDMYGNATSGLTTATLSECPIYIVCDPDSLSAG